MSKFAQAFKRVLNEDDESKSLERQAMESTLDPDTDPTDFDADLSLGPDEIGKDEVADAMSRQNQQMVSTLQGWIDEVQQFLSFLNSEDPTSIQSQLAAAIPETIMDKMKQSQQTKISRVASDLASLHQSLLGFMAQTKNARFRGV